MIYTMLGSFLISLAGTVALGFVLIPLLRRLKAGQTIKRDGPIWHLSKEGTPTMGGLMFIIAMLVAVFVMGLGEMRRGEYGHLAMLVFALIFGAIGFLDDYEKVKKHGNEGLTALQKFLLQLVVALAFVLLMRYLGYVSPSLYIPFFNTRIQLSEPIYFLFASFVIVGTVNAVNITDGVDGLLTGVTLPVALFFSFAAFTWGLVAQGIYAAALAGGLVGFLFFNFNPAKVFMGDTGSLFLGGAVCALAFSMDMPLVLVPLGLVYIIETLSDLIQIVYFKATHGKRFFKMAPIHHHFEKCGWSERKLFAVFTAFSVLCALVAWLGVRLHYSV